MDRLRYVRLLLKSIRWLPPILKSMEAVEILFFTFTIIRIYEL